MLLWTYNGFRRRGFRAKRVGFFVTVKPCEGSRNCRYLQPVHTHHPQWIESKVVDAGEIQVTEFVKLRMLQ